MTNIYHASGKSREQVFKVWSQSQVQDHWESTYFSPQSSLLDPLDHPHWSLFSKPSVNFSLKITISQTTPFGMPQSCGTSFLLLFVFLISSILHHHPALFHRHALILDRLLTFLVTFSTLVLKLSSSQCFSSRAIYSYSRILISWNYDQLFGSHWCIGGFSKCGRLSQPNWL